MNDGETFKFLRTSRSISQKDIVKNNLSRTTISKFENNKIMLSMTNFNYLLNSIDVSLEEFNFIKNNYSYNDKDQIIYLFNQLFSNSEHTNINYLIKLCDNYLLNNFSKSIKCIRNTLYVLKNIEQSNKNFNNKDIKRYTAEIWEELSKIDNWTILDIKIINCCIHFFEPDTYLLLSEQLIRSLEKFLYLNLTLLFSLQKNEERAKYFSEKALEKAYQSKRTDYIGISLIRYGLLFKKDDSVEEGLTLLKYLKDDSLIKEITKEIESYN